MTVDEFIRKWRAADLKERSAAQEHFIDLCRLLGEPTPAEADPSGTSYCFERGASKTTGANGWADVWKRGHFGWEYKGKRKDLTVAFVQLQQYALALENPPLLIVCDLERFIVRTNWTNSVSEVHELSLEDLRDASKRDILKFAMSEPERLRPGTTRATLTARAAADFATLANNLRERGHEAHAVAHFINRLVFCMFAEDVQLLPNGMFSRMLQAADAGGDFEALAGSLFAAMRNGGMVGFERVEHFNGGLFDTDETLPLGPDDIALCRRVAALDWGEIDPSILGTLFERGLDPSKRAQLGAHYTDRDNIMRIVDPVIMGPWLADWAATKEAIEKALEKAGEGASPSVKAKGRAAAAGLYKGFLDRLRAYRVLDPACGSGNFLYLALRALKDIEHRAGLEAEAVGLQREFPGVGPENVLGIELNPYAAELARVTVWIGEIQWMRRNGFSIPRQPVLRPLSNIECRDAILEGDGAASWPAASVIIGNPPFLGNKRLRASLGDSYVERLFNAYKGVVPGGADLVTYWVAKVGFLLAEAAIGRAGLVTTNSIRGSANRPVLQPLAEAGRIFEAWSDEPWVVDGAAVRVSIICMSSAREPQAQLNGTAAEQINSDLSGSTDDLTEARGLSSNLGIAFQGPVKVGQFEVPGDLAREWLLAPTNPNGRQNADVLRPWVNGIDVVRRPTGHWIIDFGGLSEREAAMYEAPFEYVREVVKPSRDANRDAQRRVNWWKLGRSGADLKRATSGLDRLIVTPRVAKFRLFAWTPGSTLPDARVNAFARSDDLFFGVLHSRFHEAWSLRLGGWHGVGNDPQYTPSKCFETFPFPAGVIPDQPSSERPRDQLNAVGEAARRLDELREAWLNPPELVRAEPEVVPGFPPRCLPISEIAAIRLAKRTLTALYNERPTWLTNAHAELDAAVAVAYGWDPSISTEEALEQLLQLNLSAIAANAAKVSRRK
ncbi:DNA methyltransferase [Sphingomonas sp.]|uniref:class I SAM-dependent DNA methyltransferase n=1 Tax=Sphingomonas sp. TaxID=28214 RepID=UPI0025EC6FCE|nr:DNA methyltransferase [Sphingomonas sp.]